MRTRKITLYYTVTPTEIIEPPHKELQRKDEWLRAVKASVPAEWKPKRIKVTYEEHDPEIENQQRFFNGTVVAYYAIQNMGTPNPDSATLKKYREEILDEMLGYDYQTVNKVIRMRRSTTELEDVQSWSTFLNELQETLFDAAGYDFPDSKVFWELVKTHGYDKAKEISVKTLWEKMQKRGL